ncbi:hypothetical protein NDU88_010341 [Pleurodeles waltl]|uniref:Uncharacterized protein n=1 Tax=Pleurodeles waltl TaxID=8319 RepID=A0AAV7RYS0_PLEWA|nr:hypothetical protein NDU88_010341 [Pleurodeles waltl]
MCCHCLFSPGGESSALLPYRTGDLEFPGTTVIPVPGSHPPVPPSTATHCDPVFRTGNIPPAEAAVDVDRAGIFQEKLPLGISEKMQVTGIPEHCSQYAE